MRQPLPPGEVVKQPLPPGEVGLSGPGEGKPLCFRTTGTWLTRHSFALTGMSPSHLSRGEMSSARQSTLYANNALSPPLLRLEHHRFGELFQFFELCLFCFVAQRISR